MSSSYSSGYYVDEAYKEKDKLCPARNGGKHKWIEKGSWPSIWKQCKYCKKTVYYK